MDLKKEINRMRFVINQMKQLGFNHLVTVMEKQLKELEEAYHEICG